MTNNDTSQPAPGVLTCPRCGLLFSCGITAGADRCWCFDLPHVLPPSVEAECLCPRCLREAIAAANAAQSGEDHH